MSGAATTSPWTESRLAELGSHGVYRLRGKAMTRLETFIDAAFAFAVTMLVISVDDVPRSYEEFSEALLSIPAFIASFFQVMMFWLGHRAWSQRFGLEDGPTLFISLVLVCGILVVVFPLRVLFSSAFGYFSGGVLPYPFPVQWENMRAVFAIYGFGFSVMCSLISLLYLHALRQAEWLGLNSAERLATRGEFESWLIPAFTGLLGMILALLAPDEWVILGGLVYSLLFVLLPVHRWLERRRMQALTATGATAP